MKRSGDDACDDDDPAMSTGGMSPTSLLLLRSEQQSLLVASATHSPRDDSDRSSSSHHDAAPVTPLATTTSNATAHAAAAIATAEKRTDAAPTHRGPPSPLLLPHNNSSSCDDESARPPTSSPGGAFFRRSNSFSSDTSAPAAAPLTAMHSGRSESMSALATSAKEQIASASNGPLRIFATPADELAMKAILSPPHLRAAAKQAPASPSTVAATMALGGRSALSATAAAIEATSANIFEQGAKLLFRGVSGGNSASPAPTPAASPATTAARTATLTAAPTTPSAAPLVAARSSSSSSINAAPSATKTSSGSAVDEDIAKLNNNILVSHPTLPPPPFANMFACDNCRDDIGTLLSKGRHHCRNCGGSFCAECTTKTVIVPFQVYLTRGEQRVCDGCYHRIKDFQSQAQSTNVTWSGLQPPPDAVFTQTFELPATEVPVTIFNCSLFLDFSPFYGHLFLTREHVCFHGYRGHKIKVPFGKVVSLIKPQFYYINALQVKTRRKEKFFFAEFNGLRDLCFLRMDQLIRAYQDGKKQFIQVRPDDLVQQALVRRKSYKLLGDDTDSRRRSNAARGAPKSTSFLSRLGHDDDASDFDEEEEDDDADDLGNLLSGKSTVGYIDIDEEESDDDEQSSDARSRRASHSVADNDEPIGSSVAPDADTEVFEPLAPDVPLTKMTVLLDCELRADVKDVFTLLWDDGVGQDFLAQTMERARDIDIVIGDWQDITPTTADDVNRGFVVSKETDFVRHRTVSSQHPPKTTFPGLPAYATCNRVQRVRVDKRAATASGGSERWDRVVISDLLRMARIPFSDYFEIETRWVFTRDGRHACHAQAGLNVNFLKSTWFKSQINSSTRSESKEVLESWAKQAAEHLQAHAVSRADRPARSSVTATPSADATSGLGGEATTAAASTRPTAAQSNETDTAAAVPSPRSLRTEPRRRSSQSEKLRADALLRRPPSAGAGALTVASVDGMEQYVRQFLAMRASPLVQLIVVLALLYCLVLLRSQQTQIEQLTAVLEQLAQSSPRTAASSLPLATDTSLAACEQRIWDGASEALRAFFAAQRPQ